MPGVIEELVPFGFFAAVILIFYFTSKYKYQLRKEMLASGVALDMPKKQYPFLEIALTIIGVGLGLGLTTVMFVQSPDLEPSEKSLLLFSFTFVLGGIGMICGYFLARRIGKNN